MKRKIKFRAWHEPSKKMFIWDDFSINGRNNCIIHITEGVFTISKIDDNSVELMQFTGLKDKNGIEIYEGDVLKGNFGTGLGYKTTKYKEFNFSISYSETQAKFHINMPSNYGKFRFHPYWNQCEVIGNVYENPELIAQQSPPL